MRLLVQRVVRAQVADKKMPAKPLASVDAGMVVLAGFEESDSPVYIEQMVQKLKGLRIFSDVDGKLNLTGSETGAEFLLVSQFTLYGECKYGNRPSFDKAAPKPKAKEYYEHFVKTCERLMGANQVKHSPFGMDLEVELVNDGPVTIWMDSQELL